MSYEIVVNVGGIVVLSDWEFSISVFHTFVLSIVVFFFFQAEDGIRDISV